MFEYYRFHAVCLSFMHKLSHTDWLVRMSNPILPGNRTIYVFFLFLINAVRLFCSLVYTCFIRTIRIEQIVHVSDHFNCFKLTNNLVISHARNNATMELRRASNSTFAGMFYLEQKNIDSKASIGGNLKKLIFLIFHSSYIFANSYTTQKTWTKLSHMERKSSRYGKVMLLRAVKNSFHSVFMETIRQMLRKMNYWFLLVS